MTACRLLFVILSLAALFSSASAIAEGERAVIDLNGIWQFQLDPQNVGETGGWYLKTAPLKDSIRVPGCWQAQGFGEPLGTLRHSYCGPAWYRRSVAVPTSWEDKTIILHVGEAFQQTQLFVNGKPAGEHDGFCTGFQFDITDYMKPGDKNTIAFRINNPGQVITNTIDDQVPYAPTGTANYLGNWGGISGNVSLEATDKIAIVKTRITPDLEHERAIFSITVQNQRRKRAPVRLKIDINGSKSDGTYQTNGEFWAESAGTNVFELAVEMPGAKHWTPDAPFLYTAEITLETNTLVVDKVKERFGMREITTRGDVLLMNGKPFYLRAYGDDHIWVRSGVAPTSREFFLKQLRLTKSYGFNGIRFHSAVPERAVFEAADEVGMLIMAELPAVYAQYFMPFTNFYRAELTRVLDAYHNDPSFLSLALGDELRPLGNDDQKNAYLKTIAEFYDYAKKLDPNRLILANDGFRLMPSDMESTFESALQQEGSLHIPFILHEFGGYYSSLPDISLKSKFDGVIAPIWLGPKECWLKTNGLSKVYETYVRNSQLLLNAGRTCKIEAARRNPGITGYEYWLITDYPGGGGEGDSWDEGWFDYFWRPKHVTPQLGRMLNSPVLMMIDPGATEATLWNDVPKDFKVWISNYGNDEIHNGHLRWKLKKGDKILAESQFDGVNVSLGKVARAAHFEIPAINEKRSLKLELILELKDSTNTFVNHWDLWSFPRPAHDKLPVKQVMTDIKADWLSKSYPEIHQAPHENGDVWLASQINSRTIQFLQNGGAVFFLAEANSTSRKANTRFFPDTGDAEGTLILNHAALRDFPHERFCNLQFYHLIEDSHSYDLDTAPRELMPIVSGIRTTAGGLSKEKDLSRFGSLFEVRVGKGKLLVCSLQLADGIAKDRPEAVFLFDRLLRYACGKEFRPTVQANQSLLAQMTSPE